MKRFYIYLHCKPNGDPFYVGKGGGSKRNRSLYFKDRNQHHKNIVAKYGVSNIDVLVFYRDSEDEAFADEVKWIKVLREHGYTLANIADGGEGASGVVVSEELRKQISKRMIGNKNGVGRRAIQKHSAETRAKISASLIGHKRNLGRKQSLQHIANNAAARLGKKYPKNKYKTVSPIIKTKTKEV